MTARRTILPLLCLLLILGGCAPAGDQGGEDPRLVAYKVPDDPTVSFIVWFKVGSQNDPPGKEGLAALTGALISQGSTTDNSYEDILHKLYPLASSYDVRVDKEMTTVSGRTHRDNIDKYFPLFTAAYLKPAFKAEDFERLRSDQKNFIEKTLRYASDEELGKAALTSFIFENTPYAHPISGTVEGLEAITLDDVKSFYATHFTGANAVVGIGGGYDDDLRRRFLATLDQLPDGTPPAPPEVAPEPFAGRHVLLVDKPDADASISFGFPIDVRRGTREFYALWIANSWLGEHRNSSSHLYQVIRETRGMNYGDYSYIEAFPEGGFRQMPPTGVGRHHQIFEVWIRTLPNEQALFATRAALRELTRLVEEGMSEDDFELTRAFLSKYHLHFAETTLERLGYAVDDRFYGIDGEGHLERFGKMISEITREEVNAAIKKHLQVKNLKFAIVTGDAEGLKAKILADEPTPITYPTPPSAEVLAEDEEIAKVPFEVSPENLRVVPVNEIFQR
ncbi:MAG: insulinase family protein [Acidobacteria bacterium]|nr:MAG: insulinase family protein [Acidobacteriota bacterium]